MMERGTSWKSISSSGEMIICPACPRCGSGNTKFCYYNNYSLTQPRYFCKACRRYWTKGGSLRNVPVGGGCRKSRRAKSSIRVSTHNNSSSSSSISTPPDNSNKYALSTSTTGNIDIAAVYANFLSQPPENQLTHHETTTLHANHHQLPAAANIPLPIEFPNFQGLHTNHPHHHQLMPDDYNGFFECGPPFGATTTRLLMSSSSEPPLFYAGDGVEAEAGLINIHHHKPNTGRISGGFFSINNNNDNGILSALPPLPGEDVAAMAMASSQGMLWRPDVSEDVILPPVDQRMSGSSAVAGDQIMINSELMLSGNVSPSFTAFNLEAIFRS